jgi:hypothetical protein
MNLTRKQFLEALLLGGAAVACGGSEHPGNCLQNGSNSEIGANHGHVLVVTKTDIAAGAAKTYDITGTADHSHSVTLTDADMSGLQQNHQAMEVSTNGGSPSHNHTITVVCV